LFLQGYSSGQRGQTVNLLASPSEVRILHPAPNIDKFLVLYYCITMQDQENGPGHGPELPSPTIVERIGKTIIGITCAYIGIKVSEDIFHFTVPYYEEIGVATAVGASGVSKRHASK
jgi:hypothetical protein